MRGFVTDPSGRSGLHLRDDLPEVEPTPGELVLDVRAYAINPGEAHLIQARSNGWRPGQDVAGIVVAAAADGSGPTLGARIVGNVDGAGWSERVAVSASRAAPLGDAVPFEKAAALPIAGLTALRALRYGGDLLGRRVLVTGATGGVGHLAVQLAVAAGAIVTAHVRSAEREPYARNLGAHHVVTSLDGAGPFHHVLDGVGGPLLRESVRALATGGAVVLYGASGGAVELGLMDFLASANEARVIGFTSGTPVETIGDDLAILAGLVADGRLDPHIGLRRDWTATQDAFEALAAREVRGKAILDRS